MSDKISARPRVALVTGGSRRVGRGISEALHLEGLNIVIHCNSSVAEANELRDHLNGKRPDSAFVVVLDLSKEVAATCGKLLDEAESRWGRLDVLVNNASNFIKSSLSEMGEGEWDSCIDVNLKAAVFLMQGAAKYLKCVGGCIVNMADLIGERPGKTHFCHSISKKALESATQNAAIALAPEIRVNAISPGCVMWPDVDKEIFENAHFRKNYIEKTPLKCIGTPEDVGNLVVFLCSSKSKFITGQIIAIDGGRGLVL